MTESAPLIRDVSDTAIWVAMYRAHETERPHPLFSDPFARRLAGERGEQILRRFGNQKRNEWAYVVRTYLFDSFVRERVAEGVDIVINLAAGLDTRPYRMDLPASLRWIEVDLPTMIAYKEAMLAEETPRCQLERVSADLSDSATRRALFGRLGAEGKKVLILSEGLLIYLGTEGASGLARELAEQKSFKWWVFDIASPKLLNMLQKQIGSELDRADATLKFAPVEGPWFFENLGWRVLDVRGSLKTAARVMKLSLLMRFFNLFPEQPRGGKGIWAGICLLENANP